MNYVKRILKCDRQRVEAAARGSRRGINNGAAAGAVANWNLSGKWRRLGVIYFCGCLFAFIVRSGMIDAGSLITNY